MKAINHQEIKANTKECQDIISLKLKAFHSQMNPHFIFNTLNAIQYFITSENKKLALEYFSMFSKLIRFYLKHLEEETICLNEEIKMLHWYLNLQKMRCNNQFEYTINTKNNLKSTEAIIPSFITQILLENIVEYAFNKQYKDNKFFITFKVEENKTILNLIHKFKRTNIQSNKNIPDYKTQILKWQHQAQLTHKILSYKVKSFILNDSKHIKGVMIAISIPNLKK